MSDPNGIKTILVGSSGAGKTNIIYALTGHDFDSKSMTTMTSTFVDKEYTINNKKYRLEIWDTAGQEKFRSLTKIFVKDSRIVIFVYDITVKKSFEEIDYWAKTVKEILGDSAVYGLAGNKKDLYMNEQVSPEEGEKKGGEIGAKFKLTSAKTEQMGIIEFAQELLEDFIEKTGGKIEKKDNGGINIEERNNDTDNGKKRFKC